MYINNYDEWFQEKSDDSTVKGDILKIDNLSSMPLLEDDKEQEKEGKGIKILTQNKLLTRLPALLLQIKVENNSHKVKTKSEM